MTAEQIESLGINWEQLPSGRWNLVSSEPFSVNGNPTLIRHKGKFSVTLEQKTRDDVLRYIRTLELL